MFNLGVSKNDLNEATQYELVINNKLSNRSAYYN